MMKKGILLVAFSVVAINIRAQNSSREVKSDLGFNTNIVFNGLVNTSGGLYNFVYKRQIATAKALRFGIQFNASFNSRTGTSTTYTIQNALTCNPGIGKEWQHVLGKKWIWYHGLDIRGNIALNSLDGYTNDIQTSRQQINSVGASLIPFAGVRFIITERLYVTTEANLSVNYFHQTNRVDVITSGVTTATQSYSNNNVTANSASAVGVFVFYRF
ncbi:hypothetical protein WSM22_09220 [Cytophagales bacterium WSM2-2]|nr:hypothetical protein WSM22_09220 [Cytophagales bacterium WSM2-2]